MRPSPANRTDRKELDNEHALEMMLRVQPDRVTSATPRTMHKIIRVSPPARPLPGLGLLALVGLISIALSPGSPCLAQASKRGEKAADSLKALAKTVQEGQVQVGEVTRALDQLCNKQNQDLRKPFKAYQKAVKKLSSLAADARKRRDGLAQDRQAYLKAWDQDLASIQQEDIRNRGQERKQKVQQELGKLAALGTQVGDTYQQFDAQLRDIQKAVGADLTPAGVQAVAPTANAARASAVSLRENLTKLSAELRSLGVAMSAKAPKK